MKKQRRVGSRVFMALVFLFLYAPIFLMIVFSFNAGNSNVIWKGFSLHWYTELFQDRSIMQSVYTTLLVSLLATVIATIAGTFASVGFYSMRPKTRSALLTVNNIPMTNADIVTGVSLCLLFVAVFGLWNEFAANYRFTLNWFGTLYRITLPKLSLGFGTMLIAHITFNIPYVILSVGPKLRQMDRNLVDAAQDLGCTWMQAFFKVILPEIKPGIISGALIAFTMSVDDFVISYFTAGSSVSTLAIEIYGMARRRISPEINAISTLLFVVVILLLAANNIREARAEKALAKRRY
ncbi:MAG TPA: ABC transporter permease [Candidatus Enterenecus stercoripullorum]|nr:ABC transporter permease [Candidatus Enterenecus stercoripullorum]